MIKNWFTLMAYLTGRLISGWKPLVWIAGCNVVILVGLAFLTEMQVVSGRITVLLKGQLHVTAEALAAIFAMGFVFYLLVSIQIISDKNDRIINSTIDELLKVLQLNRTALYVSGFVIKLTSLTLLVFFTTGCIYLLIWLIFQGNAYSVFAAIPLLIYSGAILIVIFDFFFLMGKKSSLANTYTTLSLVIIFILNATLRPFIEQSGVNEAILFLFNVFLPDLFMFVYMAAFMLVGISIPWLGILPSIFLFILIITANIICYH